MAKGLGNSYGERTEEHPNRKVARPAYGLGAAMDIRGEEYAKVRSGEYSREQALRVGIDPDEVARIDARHAAMGY